jgi:transposase InsO family protein
MKKFGIIAKQKKGRQFTKKDDQNRKDMHGVTLSEGGVTILNYLARLCPLSPNTVWRSDFTHIIYRGIHVYLATILDDYTKEIVGYAISYRHTKEFVLAAIQDALIKTGGVIPGFFHSDQ